MITFRKKGINVVLPVESFNHGESTINSPAAIQILHYYYHNITVAYSIGLQTAKNELNLALLGSQLWIFLCFKIACL